MSEADIDTFCFRHGFETTIAETVTPALRKSILRTALATCSKPHLHHPFGISAPSHRSPFSVINSILAEPEPVDTGFQGQLS
jgi:hypothetical protein